MNDIDNVTIIRIVAGLFFIVLLIVPAVFYLLSLSRVLSKCSPVSRTMEPGMVWLLFIPLFNIVWAFLVVLAIAKSVGNEFRARGIPYADPEPGKTIGLTMCICNCCGIIPFRGILAAVVGLVFWIVYWVKVAEFSRMLDAPALFTPGYPGTQSF